MAMAVPIMMLAGTALSAKSQSDETAAQAEINIRRSNQARASGQRRAIEVRRQGDALQSDARAAIAASGGVTDDVGTIKQLADIDQATDYNALAALYEGESEARGLETENVYRKRIGRTKQFATALSGASKAYGAYNA